MSGVSFNLKKMMPVDGIGIREPWELIHVDDDFSAGVVWKMIGVVMDSLAGRGSSVCQSHLLRCLEFCPIQTEPIKFASL